MEVQRQSMNGLFRRLKEEMGLGTLEMDDFSNLDDFKHQKDGLTREEARGGGGGRYSEGFLYHRSRCLDPNAS